MSRRADVVVVGGGVVGCASAWFLAREGLSVLLLERDDLAGRASGAAAGMLRPFGECAEEAPFLRWARRSHARFPELCVELRERSGIDPEFESCGALDVALSEAAEQRLRQKGERFAEDGLEWLGPEEARELEPRLAPGLRGALRCPDEAHVRSPQLARAYAGAAAQAGARLERGVTVTSLRLAGARATGVETSAGAIEAGAVVLCAGVWSTGLWTSAALGPAPPIEPVRGQILALEDGDRRLRSMLAGDGVYLVPKRDGSLVVGATEERTGFDCRVTVAGVAQLLQAAPRLVPDLAEACFRGAWAGLRPGTPDGLPLIGRIEGAEALFVAAGHYRHGVMLSPITGELVRDLVLGKALPEEASIFRPGRFG